MGKVKKEKSETVGDFLSETKEIEIEGESKSEKYKAMLERVNAIANPIASRKLSKKILKLIKKAYQKKGVIRGVKPVQKSLRKNGKGIVVLAGDVTPIDVISHFPIICEDADIPYCYIPSKEHLGQAMNSKKWAILAMITKKDDYQSLYDEVFEEVNSLPLPIQ